MKQSDCLDEIFVVDDDPAIRQTLSLVFTNAGFGVVCFGDGASLLAAVKNKSPVCIILDVHIPGKSGIDILKQLNELDFPVPIFIMSGRGDISMAVDAIRNGALDFIEKPFRGSELVERIREALNANSRRLEKTEESGKLLSLNFPGRAPLSRREQEVLSCLLGGSSNKEMARQLGISPRTIEVHRARIMEKLGAKNTADLIRIAMSDGRTR